MEEEKVEEKKADELNFSQGLAVFIVLLILLAGAIILGGRSTRQPQTVPQSQAQQDSSQLGVAQTASPSDVLGDQNMPESANNTQAQDVTELKVEDLVVGDGAEATPGAKLTVNYKGSLTDGKVFDSSYESGKPITFNLGVGEVIKGWDQGLKGMKVGGKRRLTIPPDLGYGEAGAGSAIPPNATLIFEVELLKVE